MQDLSGIRCYETLDELLADPEIDLVDICLPTTMHVETSIRALTAGKHVLLEKPIAVALDAADQIVATAREHQRQVYGCPRPAVFSRVPADQRARRQRGTRPSARRPLQADYLAPAWWAPSDLQQTGGPAIDLHIHDADFVQFLFGMPTAVSAQGYVGRGETVEYINTHYQYDGRWRSAPKAAGWRNRAVPLSTAMTCTLRRPRSSTTRLGASRRNC